MSAARIAPEQIRAIHAIKTRTRLDEGSYRAMLQGFGAASSKDLSRDEADRLLSRLRDIPGASRPVQPAAQRAKAAGRFAPKLQAMWLALYNLGAAEDRRDAAMHAFLKRQTGIEHTRFLCDPADAAPAIEALKAWLIREGVRWPAATKDQAADLLAMKRAILRAQWRRLVALGAVTASGPAEFEDGLTGYVSKALFGNSRRIGSIDDAVLSPPQLDAAARKLGCWVRRAKSVEGRHAG